MRHAKLIILLLLVSVSAAAQRISSEQVIINTQKLADLERRVESLENRIIILTRESLNHSARDDLVSNNLMEDIAQIRSIGFWLISFTITNLVGLLLFLLKDRFFSRAHK